MVCRRVWVWVRVPIVHISAQGQISGAEGKYCDDDITIVVLRLRFQIPFPD